MPHIEVSGFRCRYLLQCENIYYRAHPWRCVYLPSSHKNIRRGGNEVKEEPPLPAPMLWSAREKLFPYKGDGAIWQAALGSWQHQEKFRLARFNQRKASHEKLFECNSKLFTRRLKNHFTQNRARSLANLLQRHPPPVATDQTLCLEQVELKGSSGTHVQFQQIPKIGRSSLLIWNFISVSSKSAVLHKQNLQTKRFNAWFFKIHIKGNFVLETLDRMQVLGTAAATGSALYRIPY